MSDGLRPAERILRELGIETPEGIDLEAIAWTLGAAVNYRPLDQCEAMIVGGSKRAIITVSSNAIPSRRRFSIAHEIGHLLLGAKGHSQTGIMQFPLGREQLQAMRTGDLLFTKEQADKMRRNVRRRVEAAEATETVKVE